MPEVPKVPTVAAEHQPVAVQGEITIIQVEAVLAAVYIRLTDATVETALDVEGVIEVMQKAGWLIERES